MKDEITITIRKANNGFIAEVAGQDIVNVGFDINDVMNSYFSQIKDHIGSSLKNPHDKCDFIFRIERHKE